LEAPSEWISLILSGREYLTLLNGEDEDEEKNLALYSPGDLLEEGKL
jgi:hypothetical protein